MRVAADMLIILVLLGVHFDTTTGQKRLIDSLEQVLKGEIHDTVRVKTMNALLYRYIRQDFRQVFRRSKGTIDLARKIRFHRGESEAWVNLGVAYANESSFDSARICEEHARFISTKAKDDYGLASASVLRGWIEYRTGNNDAALRRLTAADSLGRRSGNQQAIFNASLILGSRGRRLGNKQEGYRWYHAALAVAAAIPDSTELSRAHHGLAQLLISDNRDAEAREHDAQALAIATAMRDAYSAALAHFGLANSLFWNLRKSDSALVHLEQAERYARVCFDENQLLSVLITRGVIDLYEGRLHVAIASYISAANIAREQHNLYALSYVLSQIGDTYTAQDRYEKALPYFLEAYDYSLELGDSELQARNLDAIGFSFHELGQADSALHYLRNAHAQAKEGKLLSLLAFIDHHLGIVYNSLGQLSQAEQAFNESIRISRTASTSRETARAMTWLSRVYVSQGRLPEARAAAEEAYEILIDVGDVKPASQAAESLAMVCEKQGDFERAYAARVKFGVLKDSMMNIRNTQTINELSAQYEAEQRERQIELLGKDNVIKELALARETFRRNAILAGLAALLVVTALIFYRLREKKKANTRLSNTLSELRRMQDQLIHAEKMATLGELTAGIAHEIKNPLNFVTNFSTVSGEMVEELAEQIHQPLNTDAARSEVLDLLDELQGNMGKIQKHGQRADAIVASMLLHARSQKGVRQETDINTLLREAVQLAWHGMRAQQSDFTVNIEQHLSDDLPVIEVIPQEMSRVFLNLLSNSFQAVRKRSLQNEDEYTAVVKVSTDLDDGALEVRIWDNGAGIPASIHDKIFQPFFTTKATGEGTGLGLSLSYDIVVKGHSGEIHLESEEHQFTEFTVSLPVTSG